MKKLIFFLILLFTSTVYGLNQEDLLKPDKAFQLAEPRYNSESAKITASWTIADEYYLYKKTFKFESSDKNIKLGTVNFPEALRHRDLTEGKMVDIYRKNVSIDIPVKSLDGSALPEKLPIKITHQGCYDGGVCYPPKKNQFTLVSAATTEPAIATDKVKTPVTEVITTQATSEENTANATPTDSKANNILALITNKKHKPIPVEQAFQFELLKAEKNKLAVQFQITKGHYIYQEKIKFKLQAAGDLSLGKIDYPKAVVMNDAAYGEIAVYRQNVSLDIPIVGKMTDKAKLLVEYQGCSELTGICYPPVKVTLPILDSVAASAATEKTRVVNKTEQSIFADKLKNSNFIAIIAVFFVAGIGLALTPCVFPMIPILSGIIAGQSGYLSTRRAFMLSLAYVVPMALTYAIVGVIAGLSGGAINLQVVFQTPWVISIFAFIFVLLSLSMFGFYELQMPSSVQSRLTEISNRQSGGDLWGAAIMGVLSAIIVGPCVTAPLIGALIYIAQTNDAVLGGFALFALGMGMGTPLLMIGTSASKLLPHAGVWMDTTKSIFGVMMLGLAIWMLDRVVPAQVTLILTGILLLVSSIYAGIFDPLTEKSSNFNRLFKGIGIVMFIFGLFMLLGAALGNNSLNKPLQGLLSTSTSSSISTSTTRNTVSRFEKIKGITGLNAVLEQSKQSKQIVMLDFYADWCTSCKEMEHFTFQDQRVNSSLKGIKTLQADVTASDDQDKNLLQKFGLFGPPAILFFGLDGKELKNYRLVGYYPPEKFLAHLDKVRTAAGVS